ncbi:MAG: S9 family peptidase [bacterium]|nr:S9 family peptidase [bacterium]
MPKQRKVRVDDLFKMVLPESPAISPDGTQVVYALKRVDAKENRYLSNLWLRSAQGGRPRQLTRGDQMDAAPVWSPDGKRIAFISTRDQKSNIWIIPCDGGEARQLTRLEGVISDMEFRPDGKELLFCHRPMKKVDPKERAKKATFKHITNLHHKMDGFGYFPAARQHLWACNTSSGGTRQLTSGEFDIGSPHWSPDGRQIACTTCLDIDMQHEGSSFHLHLVNAKGGKPRELTTRPAHINHLCWAPEGKSIIFAGHFGGPGEWIKFPYQLWEVSLRGENYTNLTPQMDNWPFNFIISDTAMGDAALLKPYREDGAWRIAFVQNEDGACRVYSIPREGAARMSGARLEFGDQVNTYAVHVNGLGDCVVAAAKMMDIGDIYTVKLDGAFKSRQLTNTNRGLFGQLKLTEPEEVRFKNGNKEVHGWILKPPGFREDRKYPALLEIHGGPMGQYGYTFFLEMHLLAAQGYVVAFSNPRGSCGYGNKWMYCTHGRWGGVDYDDLMAVTNAVSRKPWVDSKRLGVLGGSYGGFMTTWMLGHNKRFKAGVTMRQAGNRLTQFGASDYNMHEYYSFGAWPWDKPLAYLKQSPNFYAHKITAPLLIIHSEQDLRCPVSQADELFTILKSQGRTTEYIRFEDESHGLSRGGKPRNRVERLERILDWFKRYL